MFFLAEETTEAVGSASNFNPFDIFMIAFTIIIAWGVFRSIKARPQNKFAIAFGSFALVSFLVMDAIMVYYWFNA